MAPLPVVALMVAPLVAPFVALVLAVGPAAAGPPQSTQATPCNVCPQAVWFVNAAAPAGGAGDSWATAFRRLQPAINAASSGDCVWVAAGIYKPTQSLQRGKTFKVQKRLQILGGFNGSELCLSNRAGNFWGTVLSGDIGQPGLATDNSYTVVTVTGPVPAGEMLRVVLDGFQITAAYNDSVGSQAGGGIRAITGELSLRNCFVRRNEALLGGGLYAQGCKLSIRATGFNRNTADDGAGYYAAGGETRAFNATFRKNRARRRGGAVYLEATDPSGASLWANALFEGNQAKRGGAMFLQQGVASAPPTPWIQPGRAHLVGCTVTRNSAAVLGPALASIDHPILVSLAGRMRVEDSIVWNNSGPGPEIVGWIGTNVADSIVPVASPFAGGSNLTLDPVLMPPGFRPAPGSPAIDAGNPLWLLADELDLDDDGDLLEPTPVDRLGRKRIQGPGLDLGASEY